MKLELRDSFAHSACKDCETDQGKKVPANRKANGGKGKRYVWADDDGGGESKWCPGGDQLQPLVCIATPKGGLRSCQRLNQVNADRRRSGATIGPKGPRRAPGGGGHEVDPLGERSRPQGKSCWRALVGG